jgi:hypothetical protein
MSASSCATKRTASVRPAEPPAGLVKKIFRLRAKGTNGPGLDEAYRDILHAFRAMLADGRVPAESWRAPVAAALGYLGGQAVRSGVSMRDYDHKRFGPFLAISNEGGGVRTICEAAGETPKAQAVRDRASHLTLGIAVDGERLGAVGEVVPGPGEYADIWYGAVDRLLMTTNVGSRTNLRFYKRPVVITLAAADPAAALAQAQAELAAAFKPFLEAPGGPRPLTVFVDPGVGRTADETVRLLQSLKNYLRQGKIARPAIHGLGLHATLDPGEGGRDQALAAVDIADRAGFDRVAFDGVVRAEADAAISLPGLLNYLAPEFLAPVLLRARKTRVVVEPANQVDADTVARHIWSGLNTVRGMGFDLGKYALVPLTLEQCDAVVAQVQGWFEDWSAAPVFYADQGLLTADRIYTGSDTAAGAEVWLKMVARHGVRLVLIDTIDKSKGWKLVKSGGDPKGLLTIDEIGRLERLANKLGVNVMWAGGLEPEQAYELGRLGVFGIYVTTDVCDPAPVTGAAYLRDPALAALKRPNPEKILQVKTLLEAGFFASPGVSLPKDLAMQIKSAGRDIARLRPLLVQAWAASWRARPR